MISYLLNATVIWLTCLLLFDLLLKRETFHHYNRMYLLASFLLGLLLPLISWQPEPAAMPDTWTPALQRSTELRTVMADSVMPAASFDYASVLWTVYLLGAVACWVLMQRELLQIRRLYRNGRRSQAQEFVMVETGIAHSPFSFFNYVFVGNKDMYEPEEWERVRRHELRHVQLRHSIDKVLFQLLRILFWFHPLVHLYYKRLMMVHEYQADEVAAAKDPRTYGNFLIEQSILQQAPALAHSFNYSPLKNRIKMITKKKSSGSRIAKYFLALPIIVALSFLCSTVVFSHDKVRKGNKITFKGNNFELKGFPAGDTMEVMDPSTQEIKMIVMRRDSVLDKMNGKPIYNDDDMQRPVFAGGTSFEQYIFEKMQPELDQLEDGTGYIIGLEDLVVDEKGRLVYYTVGIVRRQFKQIPKTDPGTVSPQLQDKIRQKLMVILDGSATFKPAIKDGKPVIGVLYSDFGRKYTITVQNHHASLVAS